MAARHYPKVNYTNTRASEIIKPNQYKIGIISALIILAIAVPVSKYIEYKDLVSAGWELMNSACRESPGIYMGSVYSDTGDNYLVETRALFVLGERWPELIYIPQDELLNCGLESQVDIEEE
jgi:hypothetical protein